MGHIKEMRCSKWFKLKTFTGILLLLFPAILSSKGDDAPLIPPDHADNVLIFYPAEQSATSNLVIIAEPKTNESFIAFFSSSNRWDRWHKKWSSNVVGVANYIDRFFADEQAGALDNHTKLKLRLGIEFKERENPEFIHKASLSLALPSLNERLQLVVEGIFEPDEPLDELERSVDQTQESDTDAALRYNLRDDPGIKLDADAGVRFGTPSQAYLKLRGSRSYELSRQLQLRLIETARWFTLDGFVVQSEMQWNKRMGWDWLLRSSSQVEWREDRDGFRPSQVFSIFKTLSRQRILRMDIGATWPETPKPVDRLYYTRFSYRKLIHSNWVFMELKPGVEFHEDHDYASQLVFAIQFEFILGNLGKRDKHSPTTTQPQN